MRHPLWILNSALLFLLLIAVCFILLSLQPSPEWDNITPGAYATPVHKRASQIALNKIYERDLFGTFIPELPAQEQGTNYIIPLPQPPAPRAVRVPSEPVPQFLEPLKITLKGIIVVLDDDTKNRAIIMDSRTNKEELFKVGDTLEDAQLIKIFNKKVIFLRSNGQQEVLYLRPKDAQMDPLYATANTDYKDIVKEVADRVYLISPKEFSRRVRSLSQFIDLLDLTTVFKQGKSVGCRIGNIESDSLASALGFKSGDIILTINAIPVSETQNRIKIYKDITDMQTKDTIVVQLLRDGQEAMITYTLDEFKLPQGVQAAQQQVKAGLVPGATGQEQLHMLQQRHKFAPTLSEIREQERQNMLKKGRSPRNNLTSKLPE